MTTTTASAGTLTRAEQLRFAREAVKAQIQSLPGNRSHAQRGGSGPAGFRRGASGPVPRGLLALSRPK